MLGAIIAILYVPAGMQRLLLVNLTLFQWAGGGEGGGGAKCTKSKFIIL